MGRIKLNLVSGASVDKPLISAFTENGNSYVILDNEINGSMGLPIILVSKFIDNKLVKIVDQGEWQLVKEYLKNIIAGNKVEFIKMNNELNADDIYFTQLTLPVPSFDALKNSYTFVEEDTNTVNPVAEAINNTSQDVQPEVTPLAEAVTPVAPVNDVPVENAQPVEEVTTFENVEIPSVDAPLAEPIPAVEQPIAEAPVSAVQENDVNLDNPLLNNLNTPLTEEVKVEEKEPEITPTPIIETPNIVPVVEESLFKEQKEAFMQACENMFDALVQKFEKELENRK